ncbi:MAG: hypothetical protein MUP21_02090 [Dehalococcoidia bacterium]|nr:hypothetical protein [Dehalococcoidia bacterium]
MRLLCLFGFLMIITLLSGGCRKNKKADPAPGTDELLETLRPKFVLYHDLVVWEQDPDGFIGYDACDSLLFSSLIGAGGLPVSVEKARDADGAWFRRPLTYEPCYPGNSASSISKDMFLGLFVYIWHNKRLELAEQIFSYGAAHNWKMGEGDFTRVVLSPGLQATLAEIIARLGGEDHKIIRAIPVIFTDSNRGFAAHLDVLHILLRGEMIGSVGQESLRIVNSHLSRNAQNGFFAYVSHKFTDGDQSQAVSVLLDQSLFPDDRLPTSEDHKEPYLWQRELGDDWLPSTEAVTQHPGADFYFLASQLLGLTQVPVD